MTDVEGKPSYLACLCFFECVTQKRDSNSLNINLNENSNLEDVKDAISASEYTVEETYYVPRCLCVVSRNRYYQTLKVSLQNVKYTELLISSPILLLCFFNLTKRILQNMFIQLEIKNTESWLF